MLIFQSQTAVSQASDAGSLKCINNADFDQTGNEMHFSTFYYEFIRGGGKEEKTERNGQTRLLLCSVSSSFHYGLMLDDSDVKSDFPCDVNAVEAVHPAAASCLRGRGALGFRHEVVQQAIRVFYNSNLTTRFEIQDIVVKMPCRTLLCL